MASRNHYLHFTGFYFFLFCAKKIDLQPNDDLQTCLKKVNGKNYVYSTIFIIKHFFLFCLYLLFYLFLVCNEFVIVNIKQTISICFNPNLNCFAWWFFITVWNLISLFECIWRFLENIPFQYCFGVEGFLAIYGKLLFAQYSNWTRFGVWKKKHLETFSHYFCLFLFELKIIFRLFVWLQGCADLIIFLILQSKVFLCSIFCRLIKVFFSSLSVSVFVLLKYSLSLSFFSLSMFVLSSFFISLSPSFSFYHCLWFFVSLYWKKTFFTLLFFLCLYIRASRIYEISLSLKLCWSFCCFVYLSVYLNLVFLCLPTFFYWPRPDDNCISWLMKLKLSGQSPKITVHQNFIRLTIKDTGGQKSRGK